METLENKEEKSSISEDQLKQSKQLYFNTYFNVGVLFITCIGVYYLLKNKL